MRGTDAAAERILRTDRIMLPCDLQEARQGGDLVIRPFRRERAGSDEVTRLGGAIIVNGKLPITL